MSPKPHHILRYLKDSRSAAPADPPCYRLTVTGRDGRVRETMEGAYGPLALKARIDAALAVWGDCDLTVAVAKGGGEKGAGHD